MKNSKMKCGQHARQTCRATAEHLSGPEPYPRDCEQTGNYGRNTMRYLGPAQGMRQGLQIIVEGRFVIWDPIQNCSNRFLDNQRAEDLINPETFAAQSIQAQENCRRYYYGKKEYSAEAFSRGMACGKYIQHVSCNPAILSDPWPLSAL